MEDRKVERARPQEIRVIDRRSFTSDGDRRSPDTPPEDEAAAAARSADHGGRQAAGEPAGGAAVPSAHFQNLVLNLARQAASHLGSGGGPPDDPGEVDFDAAQHLIDLLAALEVKTRGNLTPDEREMLEGLIGDLQMQFVGVRSRAPQGS
jgi:hypothetical protein